MNAVQWITIISVSFSFFCYSKSVFFLSQKNDIQTHGITVTKSNFREKFCGLSTINLFEYIFVYSSNVLPWGYTNLHFKKTRWQIYFYNSKKVLISFIPIHNSLKWCVLVSLRIWLRVTIYILMKSIPVGSN